MTPERRFYKSSRQTSTMPDIRSTLNEDLYLVFEGLNPDNGHPILKAHLNALVMWIWIGVWIVLIGTVLALVPNAPAQVRVAAPALFLPTRAEPVVTGD
jgi:cytochrome c-type biogenesis protein CcmF